MHTQVGEISLNVKTDFFTDCFFVQLGRLF